MRVVRVILILVMAVLGAAGARGQAPDLPASSPRPRQVKIITCGTLLAVPGQPPLKNATVIVSDGVIERVTTERDPQPAAAEAGGPPPAIERIDLSDKYVLPGLIDCHVHLTLLVDRTYLQRGPVETPEFVVLRGAVWARQTLEAGFTTVRDLGAITSEGIIALRDATNAGYVTGPRIVAAGRAVSITGGHADPTNLLRQDVVQPVDERTGVADGADACAKAVRHQVKLGADCIKLTATGGVLSPSTAGLRQHFTDEELASIVRTAHMLGRKVAAHAHGTDGVNAALRAGVDSVEHGTYVDDESIRLFKERGAYFVPTMLAAATVGENAEKPGYYLPMIAAKARQVAPRIKEAVRKAHAAGVKIAFGTDSGVSEHGRNAREFALLVDAGLTPTEAIVAATVSAADLLGLSGQIGTIEPGKRADFVAVAGDPTADVRELERIRVVIKDGQVVRR